MSVNSRNLKNGTTVRKGSEKYREKRNRETLQSERVRSEKRRNLENEVSLERREPRLQRCRNYKFQIQNDNVNTFNKETFTFATESWCICTTRCYPQQVRKYRLSNNPPVYTCCFRKEFFKTIFIYLFLVMNERAFERSKENENKWSVHTCCSVLCRDIPTMFWREKETREVSASSWPQSSNTKSKRRSAAQIAKLHQ